MRCYRARKLASRRLSVPQPKDRPLPRPATSLRGGWGSRTPTSRSRFATADLPGRVRESHPGAVRAANGTRAGRRSHPRIRRPPHARPVARRPQHRAHAQRHAGPLPPGRQHMPHAERLRSTVLPQPWHGHPPRAIETSRSRRAPRPESDFGDQPPPRGRPACGHPLHVPWSTAPVRFPAVDSRGGPLASVNACIQV